MHTPQHKILHEKFQSYGWVDLFWASSYPKSLSSPREVPILRRVGVWRISSYLKSQVRHEKFGSWGWVGILGKLIPKVHKLHLSMRSTNAGKNVVKITQNRVLWTSTPPPPPHCKLPAMFMTGNWQSFKKIHCSIFEYLNEKFVKKRIIHSFN